MLQRLPQLRCSAHRTNPPIAATAMALGKRVRMSVLFEVCAAHFNELRINCNVHSQFSVIVDKQTLSLDCSIVTHSVITTSRLYIFVRIKDFSPVTTVNPSCSAGAYNQEARMSPSIYKAQNHESIQRKMFDGEISNIARNFSRSITAISYPCSMTVIRPHGGATQQTIEQQGMKANAQLIDR